MFKNVNRYFISHLDILKNQNQNQNQNQKHLDFLKKYKYKYNKNQSDRSDQFSLVNYKIKPNSIIVYKKPIFQFPQVSSSQSLHSEPPFQSFTPLQKLQLSHTIKKYFKLYNIALLSISGLSIITICSYGYLIYNNLELLFLL